MCAEIPSCPVCGSTAEFSKLHLHLQTQHQKSEVSRALLHEIAPYPPTDLSFFHDESDATAPKNGFKGAGTSAWDGDSELEEPAENPKPSEELPPA